MGRRGDLPPAQHATAPALGPRPAACHHLLTGLTIHFWRLLLSQALRRSLASWGRMKDWGKKLNSFLPKRLCMRDRFRHSRSFRPIWKEPGKWFSYRRDKVGEQGEGLGKAGGSQQDSRGPFNLLSSTLSSQSTSTVTI